MARSRSPNSVEAERMYREGMKLVDIAKKIGVPDSTVRRWKSTQKWDRDKNEQSKKKETERSGRKKPNARKAGAPLGNKNAVGHAPSVPLRNENAVKHGAYRRIYWDSLSEEELEMINDMDDSEELQLIMQLQALAVSERRLMRRIKDFQEAEKKNNGFLIRDITKNKKLEDLVDSRGKSISNGAFQKETETTITHTEAALNSIMALEGELTRVRKAKTRAIEVLAKYRMEKEKIEKENTGSNMADDWISAVCEEDET